jgi:hypothetical protein
MPGDVFFVEKRNGVANGDGGAGSAGGLAVRMSERDEIFAEPAALNEADDGLRIGGQDRRATLPKRHRVAEQKNFGGRGGLVQLGGFEREDFTWRAVLDGLLKTLRILQSRGMERKRENGLARSRRLGCKRQIADPKVAGEGIGRDVQDGHVMRGVRGNDSDGEKLRRAIGAADDDPGLAAVAKRFQNVGGSQKVSLFVNKEAVPKERVVVAACGRRLVEAVNDGRESGSERGVRRGIVSGGGGEEDSRPSETDEQKGNDFPGWSHV